MNPRRNLPALYAIALLQGMVFYAPIASLYRQAAGLSLSQIALIEGASYLFCLAMELPWGMLADRIGYRRTMIVCCGLYFLSKLVFWRAQGFSAFLLERFLLSAALAGFSGVDESLIYLSCGESDGHRAFGLYDAFGTAGLLLAAAVYTLWIGERYRLAALITAASYGLALLCALLLVEVRPQACAKAPALRGFVDLLRQTLRRRRFLAFLLGFALYREAVQVVTVWLSQNQYLRCGMDAHGVGASYLAVTLLSLSGALSKRLADALGERRFAAACYLLTAACCALLCIVRVGWLSVLFVGLVATAGALLRPLAATLCNRRADAALRATHLSIFALLQDSAAAAGELAFGRAADFSLNAAFLLCVAACLAAWICTRAAQAEG